MIHKNICIIPARGGSKRIPRKNIKDFLGQPIISYSIKTALSTNLFDEVMVSTDDIEIANIAKNYGANVPFFRSKENANDFSTTLDVVHEVLNNYKTNFSNICILYPTAPLASKNRIIEGFHLLQKHEAAIPIVEYRFPVWRSFKLNHNKVEYMWPAFEKKRSQDLQKLYHDAGQWYWIRRTAIKDSLIPPNTAALLLSSLEVQDIDEIEDWKLCEIKYKVHYHD